MKRKLLYSLFVILCVGLLANAQDLQSLFLQKWGGLNTKLNPKLLTESESPDMSNMDLEEAGSVRDRDLFAQYNSSSGVLGSNAITGLFKFYTSSAKYFVACAGSNVASGTAGAFSTDISPTINTVTAGTFWDASSFNNKLYLFNPSVPMMRWDGTRSLYTTDSRPALNCRYTAVHRARLWAASPELSPHTVYYSSLNDGDDWSTTGGTLSLPDLTATITGLVSWGGVLYIFTETDIYVLQGYTPNNFSLVKSNSGVGAIAPRSIKVSDRGIIFLARTGVYAFNGSNSSNISDKIEPTLNDINKTYIKSAAALWDGQGNYWLAYPYKTASYNNKVVIYNTLLKEWYMYDNLNINYFCRAYGGTDKGELYGGSSTNNGIVWLLQEAGGVEQIVHDTISEFENGVTFNTSVLGTENSPKVKLLTVETLGRTSYESNSNDKLILHLDGADGATNTTDASESNHTIAVFQGNAQLDTAQKVYGVSSLLLDGTNSFIATGDDADWTLSNVDFTIETWVRWANLPSAADGQCGIVSKWVTTANQLSFFCAIDNVAGTYYMDFGYSTTGADSDENNYSSAVSLETGIWYHLAWVRRGNTLTYYLDGVSVGTLDLTGVTIKDSNCDMNFGNIQSGGGYVHHLDGWMDEIVFTKDEAKYQENFTPNKRASNGTLTSDNINIGAAGAAALGTISWVEANQTNSDIQFTTRTGVTDDSVYYNGWENWVSTSTVLNEITGSTSVWHTSDTLYFPVEDFDPQPRDILYYETDDAVSPNCVAFGVSRGTASINKYADGMFPAVDLSNYKYIGYWLKSPSTGNSVKLYIGEATGNTVAYITANTVNANTWEYHYWPIDHITDTDIDSTKYMKIEYLGNMEGQVILGQVYAYDFFDDDETISSTPNDWIQYKAILGSANEWTSPLFTSVTLEYMPAAGTAETSLSSYYKTKWFDFGQPMKDKDFLDIFLEIQQDNTVTYNTTMYCDWSVDSDTQTGTFTFPVASTGNTVRLENHFPSSVYGKTLQLNFRNTDKDAKITIRACEIRYRLRSM